MKFRVPAVHEVFITPVTNETLSNSVQGPTENVKQSDIPKAGFADVLITSQDAVEQAGAVSPIFMSAVSFVLYKRFRLKPHVSHAPAHTHKPVMAVSVESQVIAISAVTFLTTASHGLWNGIDPSYPRNPKLTGGSVVGAVFPVAVVVTA